MISSAASNADVERVRGALLRMGEDPQTVEYVLAMTEGIGTTESAEWAGRQVVASAAEETGMGTAPDRLRVGDVVYLRPSAEGVMIDPFDSIELTEATRVRLLQINKHMIHAEVVSKGSPFLGEKVNFWPSALVEYP